MDPELTYRFELARLLIAQVDTAMAVQECAGDDLAFHRSGKFWREQIIGGLQLSVETFAPVLDEGVASPEIAGFIRAIEYGEVPAPKAGETPNPAKSKILGGKGAQSPETATSRAGTGSSPVHNSARPFRRPSREARGGATEAVALPSDEKSCGDHVAMEMMEMILGIGIVMLFIFAIGSALILIDDWIAKRRLRRLQRETDEARDREKEITARPKFR